MRWLITGGAGFIGSTCAARLLEQGHSVTAIDDLSTGRLSNIEAFRDDPGFRFVEASVETPDPIQEIAPGHDVILHLASVVGVRRVLDSPAGTICKCHDMTKAVFDAALSNDIRVFYASSSEVYGNQSDQPLREDADLMPGGSETGRWAYAVAKLAGEHLAIGMHREMGLRAVVGRLFNTTGPGQAGAYGMVVPRFVCQALKGEPITVIGDGRQTRCFTHVDDTVGGILGMMASDSCVGGLFNLGGNEQVSIVELARRVRRITGSDSPVEHIEPGALGKEFADIRHRKPDTSRLRRVTGWRPRRDLDTIITDTVHWHRAQLALADA